MMEVGGEGGDRHVDTRALLRKSLLRARALPEVKGHTKKYCSCCSKRRRKTCRRHRKPRVDTIRRDGNYFKLLEKKVSSSEIINNK